MSTRSSQMNRVDHSNKESATTINLVAVVEATSVNAVAKNLLEFHRAALSLRQSDPSAPNVQTSIVTFERSGGPPDAQKGFVTAARDMGLEIDVIPEAGRFDLRVLPALRRIVMRRGPDIVVTHQVKSHFLMKLSGLWRRYPWVAFHHGYTTTDRKVRAYNQLNRWSLPGADTVITVCEAFARELTHSGVKPERIRVQHNSIRPQAPASDEEVKRLRTHLKVAADEHLVLTVGRLSREKAHVDLLAALKHLREMKPEIKARLVIVGDGPEWAQLEASTDSLGLRPWVVFAGHIDEVRPYYDAADMLTLPSHSEGSPYVLLEGMAANLPIVATAVGGVPEIVEDNVSALLVSPNDPAAMADAIARVLTDGQLKRALTSAASILVSTRHSPETYVRALLEIYRVTISTRGGR
jgi:glycosyltransferase involved in cell wall biosynthesis